MANTDASSLARVVVYSRVSTQMQVEEGHSLDTQERLCREYVERKLAGRIAKIDFFREEGKSGACTVRQLRSGAEPVRPVLSDLVDAATQGEYTHLVTYEVSRVSREFQDWVMIHSLLLKPAGVKTLVMSGDLDLDDEDDEFVGNLLALVSDRERKLIRRRILDARESRRQAGYLPGGHPPYGWQWEPQDTVAPGARRNIIHLESEAPWVLHMMDRLLREGWGVARIARDLIQKGVESSPGKCYWTGPSVWERVTHPIHAGYIRGKQGELIQGAHYGRRLFDLEVHHQILDKLASRASLKTRTNSDTEYPLLGILRCGHCGRRLHAHRGRTGVRHYRCGDHNLGRPDDCPGTMRKAEVVERAVARTIGDFVSSPTLSALVGEEAEALLRERAKSRAEELHKLEQEKEKLGQRLTTLAETFTDGLMSPESFSRVTREWTDKEAQLSVRIAELSRDGEQTAADRRMLARVEEALRSFPTTWEDLPPQRIRELLLQLVETLTLARDDASAGQLLLTTKLRFMPEMVTRIPTGTLRPDGRGTRREPTLRQLAAIALKTQGLSDADCARRLGVQLPAIRGYLHNARRRTGAATNEELFDSCADLLQEYAALLPLDGRVKMPHPESPEPLSPRQRQVWELRAKGLTYRQIAEQLGTTVGSVSAHMHEARRRLGITREQVPE